MDIFISLILQSFLVIAPIAILIALQIYLSKENQKWKGLLLPIFTGLLASFLLYLSVTVGLANSPIRLLLFIIFLYLPTILLMFIYQITNKNKKAQSETISNTNY